VIQTQVTIVEKEIVAPAWWRLTISAPDLSPRLLPGQFLLLRCAGRFTCYLRRPIFPTPLADDGLTLLLRPDPDPGLAWLLTRKPGDKLDVIGPLGAGFPLPDTVRNLLLVSDTQALDPLLGQMRQAIDAGISVTLALGGSQASTLYPVSALPPVVEFQAATLDGSLGHRGPVTDLLPELLTWADSVCAVGSINLYRTLKVQAGKMRLKAETGFLYGLVTHNRLACGVGACLSCVLETEAGLKLTCVDGPVFDLAALDL
jgi:dihydroorotate dehydrogenase electron transfer subunit